MHFLCIGISENQQRTVHGNIELLESSGNPTEWMTSGCNYFLGLFGLGTTIPALRAETRCATLILITMTISPRALFYHQTLILVLIFRLSGVTRAKAQIGETGPGSDPHNSKSKSARPLSRESRLCLTTKCDRPWGR